MKDSDARCECTRIERGARAYHSCECRPLAFSDAWRRSMHRARGTRTSAVCASPLGYFPRMEHVRTHRVKTASIRLARASALGLFYAWRTCVSIG
eukprot:6205276-Pleurochrysis_carterae.AAC.4